MSSSAGGPAFAALPGAARQLTEAGAYLKAGRGERGILLLNAFGLSIDLFAPLAARLADRFTLFAPDLGEREGDEDKIGASYYDGPDHEGRFFALADAIAAAEGMARLSAVSWCSGAKYALALAAARPGLVDGLVLLTPSFVEDVPDEDDSGFEKSLLTMCKVVSGQPASAPGMARSMLALLEKGAGASPPPYFGHVKKPFGDPGNMTEYAGQLLNFRAHDAKTFLPGVSQPVLLVTAAQDDTTSPARAKRLCAALPDAVGWEAASGDHYLLHQRPDVVAGKILQFLTEGPPPSLSDEDGIETLRTKRVEMEAGEI